MTRQVTGTTVVVVVEEELVYDDDRNVESLWHDNWYKH